MKKDWVKTDDFQFVLEKKDKEFKVVDIVQSPEGFFVANYLEINLNDYNNEEIQEMIKPFGYKTIKDVFVIYGDAGDQIIAECIVESDNSYTVILDTLAEVSEWLESIDQGLEII